jgi:hypothetical protein
LAHDLNLGRSTLSHRLYDAKEAVEKAVKKKEESPNYYVTMDYDVKESFINLLDNFPTAHKNVVDTIKSLLQKLYE